MDDRNTMRLVNFHASKGTCHKRWPLPNRKSFDDVDDVVVIYKVVMVDVVVVIDVVVVYKLVMVDVVVMIDVVVAVTNER